MIERPEQKILGLTVRSPSVDSCWISTADTSFVESFAGSISAGESAWIHGSHGVGKTALVSRLETQNCWSYYDCSEISSTDTPYFFDAMAEIDTLILDHVDYWLLDREIESAIFSWWKRREGGLCLVSRSSPRLPDMFALPDLRSRAISGLIFELSGFDDGQCDQLFRCQVRERGLILTDEVIRFLTPRLPRNPKRIVQLIEYIDQASLKEKRRITIPWLTKLLDWSS